MRGKERAVSPSSRDHTPWRSWIQKISLRRYTSSRVCAVITRFPQFNNICVSADPLTYCVVYCSCFHPAANNVAVVVVHSALSDYCLRGPQVKARWIIAALERAVRTSPHPCINGCIPFRRCASWATKGRWKRVTIQSYEIPGYSIISSRFL